MLLQRCFFSFRSLILLSFLITAFQSTLAQDRTPVPIRPRMLDCSALLSKQGMGDGVGLPLSTGGLQDFETSLDHLIESEGASALRGSHLYITGIEMGDERAIREKYEAELEVRGFGKGEVTVHVLSAPRSLVAKQIAPALNDAWHRLQYFFPSLKRDFQKPLASEILTGIAATVPLELPNAVYLMKTLPSPDAQIVLGVHSATLLAYTVFSQTLLNWLLRPGTKRMELFLKQCTLSMPFILNYRVFGHFSEILAKIQSEGYSYLANQGPGAIADFIATDGFTTILQTVFYSVVITKGAGEWVNGQIIEKNQAAARATRPILQAPVLIADALLLAYATTSQNILFHVGPLAFNDGHAMLIGITAMGWAAYRPAVLDFLGIRPYFASQKLMARVREFFGIRKKGDSPK
ncbi:MAG: hypothetical protein EBX52_11145 [Proteobacteria bacterium]|nr:hypothetical protein [Pseudomonadota bacterium]